MNPPLQPPQGRKHCPEPSKEFLQNTGPWPSAAGRLVKGPQVGQASCEGRTRQPARTIARALGRRAQGLVAVRYAAYDVAVVAHPLGRDAELRDIADALAVSGLVGVLIEGEAGVGKTTVWEAALSQASGAKVTMCRAVQSETALSFSGLIDLLGESVPALLEGLPPLQRRALEAALCIDHASTGVVDHRAVGAATVSILATLAASGPLVLGIDDVQWLDRASARALGFAFRRLTGVPVAVVATMRLDSDAAVAPEVNDLVRDPKMRRVRLGPLSLGATELVLGVHLGLRLPRTALVRLHETSRGNPFFALELGRALADAATLPTPGEPLPIPSDLRALLAARLRRMPPQARDAVLLVALLSQPAENTLAAAFGSGWDAALDRARADGIVDVDGGAVRFVHPLLASVVIATATQRERRVAHERLARASQEEDERVLHAALAASGVDEGIAAALERASMRATRRGAPDAAAELAELAGEMTPAGCKDDVLRRQTMAGAARFSAGDSERASQLFTATLAAAAPGPERGAALWRLARVRYHLDDVAASRRLLEDAVKSAGDDTELCAAVHHDLAYACFATGDLRATAEHAETAAELAEGTPATQILADSLAQVAVARFLLGQGLHHDLMDRARALETWDEHRPALFRPTVAVAHILSWGDRIEPARELLVHAEHELLQRGDESSLPFLWYHAAELDCWRGDWVCGEQRAAAADRLAVQTSQTGMRALTSYAVALLAAHRGDVHTALASAHEGLSAAAASGHAMGASLNVAVLGFVELSRGHPDRADALFAPLIAAARAGGFDEPAAAWWLPDEIESLVQLGEVARAQELTQWMQDRAVAIGRETGLASAARCRGLIAASAGRTDDALAACDEALSHHARVQVPFPYARTLLVKGQIARRARRWALARDCLSTGVAEFERLGAQLWAARARDELACVGGRRPACDGLSASERRIADLVASGRSNKEVAEILFLSPRTVSANLARVYRKLGVASRTEMATRLRADTPG